MSTAAAAIDTAAAAEVADSAFPAQHEQRLRISEIFHSLQGEADAVGWRRTLWLCMPHLGPCVGKFSGGTPLPGRGALFPEDLDKSDPWQFKNFRVV